ncbi:MAG: formate/nitrite transporter family protein [Terriglobia bacterium]|jgi:formate/nitrite transporter
MTIKPGEIVSLAGDVGRYKADLGVPNFLVRGFMGGMFIAMGATLAMVCSTGLETPLGPGFKAMIAGAVFPVGLVMIVITGMSLFTGDTMLIPVAVFQGKTTWQKVGWAWLWVYAGNFAGSLFWAYLMIWGLFHKPGTADLNAFGQSAVTIAQLKTLSYATARGAGLRAAFAKGIACNILVNLAILLGISAEHPSGKILGIWFPIMSFVACGFEHSVANMYFVPVGMMLGAGVTWSQFLKWNLLPVTLGNIVGGLVFVGAAYCFCFRRELSPSTSSRLELVERKAA